MDGLFAALREELRALVEWFSRRQQVPSDEVSDSSTGAEVLTVSSVAVDPTARMKFNSIRSCTRNAILQFQWALLHLSWLRQLTDGY